MTSKTCTYTPAVSEGGFINTHFLCGQEQSIMPLIMNACKKLHNGYSVMLKLLVNFEHSIWFICVEEIYMHMNQ